jgi:hypothetical protein
LFPPGVETPGCTGPVCGASKNCFKPLAGEGSVKMEHCETPVKEQ